MNERLLHYIWQFQCYNRSSLKTCDTEDLQIIHPGTLNTNQGPDFMNAKIRIGPTTWAGSIELHINTSDWKNHKHSEDKNYNNVVLHVVWQHDIDLQLPFATLVLQDRVSKLLLKKYGELMMNRGFIPCKNNIHQVGEITWLAWKDRMFAERLTAKSREVFSWLKMNNNHWEETLWWLIAKNFGLKLNSEAFLAIAQSIPVNILAKCKNQIHQLEALLFGQAGLLEHRFSEDYPLLLQKEYHFLKKKYRLKTIPLSLNFLRMRPSNFPTVRLAQLAMLIHETSHLFARIRSAVSLQSLMDSFNVTANDYWHYHYVFDEIAAFKKKKTGRQMTENILINTVIPLVYAYGSFLDEATMKQKAVQWSMEIKAEQNSILSGFESLGIANKTAYDSQALLHLKNVFCDQKRCLDCAIGNKLISME